MSAFASLPARASTFFTRGVYGMLPWAFASWPVPDLLLDGGAHGLKVEPHLLEHAHGHALPQLDQAEQDVLGADVVVVEAVGLLARQRQHLLGARREVVHRFLGHGEVGRRVSCFRWPKE